MQEKEPTKEKIGWRYTKLTTAVWCPEDQQWRISGNKELLSLLSYSEEVQ